MFHTNITFEQVIYSAQPFKKNVLKRIASSRDIIKDHLFGNNYFGTYTLWIMRPQVCMFQAAI